MTVTVTQQGTCVASGSPQYGAMSGVWKISPGDEKELMEAVATVGPVAAAVDATSNSFRVVNLLAMGTHYDTV